MLETHCTQQPKTAASYDGPVVTPHPPARRRRRYRRRCCRRRCHCRRRRRCRHRCPCRRRRRRHSRQAGDEFLASQKAFFCPQVLRYATSNVRLLVPRSWDRRAYRLVWHITKGGVERMIGGPDWPPSSPYFAHRRARGS